MKLTRIGTVDDTNREALIDVLQSLLDAVMDDKVSYMQTTMHLIAEGGAAGAIEAAARAAAIPVNVTPKTP